jgi:hypothetical protein
VVSTCMHSRASLRVAVMTPAGNHEREREGRGAAVMGTHPRATTRICRRRG